MFLTFLVLYESITLIEKLNSPDIRADKGESDVARGKNRMMAVMDVSMRQGQNNEAGM